MPLLSVAIVTLNEEENLPRTLASVQWAEEIIVVDSGSTDRTVEIARSYGAKVIERAWPGFAAQKNFAIAQCTGTWILSLDADEELTPALQQQMRLVLASNPTCDGYCLKRRNLFLSKWIKHGGFYPDPKLRLFRRSTANFAITPQFEARLVHETIAFDGKCDTLDYDIIHHAYPTLSTYIEHMDRYSSLGAEILITKGRKPVVAQLCVACVGDSTVDVPVELRLSVGLLDGREGLLLHLYHATYTSWKYAKAWGMSKAQNSPSAVA